MTEDITDSSFDCAGSLAYLFSQRPLSRNEQHEPHAVYGIPTSWLFPTFDDARTSRASSKPGTIAADAEAEVSGFLFL